MQDPHPLHPLPSLVPALSLLGGRRLVKCSVCIRVAPCAARLYPDDVPSPSTALSAQTIPLATAYSACGHAGAVVVSCGSETSVREERHAR